MQTKTPQQRSLDGILGQALGSQKTLPTQRFSWLVTRHRGMSALFVCCLLRSVVLTSPQGFRAHSGRRRRIHHAIAWSDGSRGNLSYISPYITASCSAFPGLQKASPNLKTTSTIRASSSPSRRTMTSKIPASGSCRGLSLQSCCSIETRSDCFGGGCSLLQMSATCFHEGAEWLR